MLCGMLLLGSALFSVTIADQSVPQEGSRRQDITQPDVNDVISAARERLKKDEEAKHVLKSVTIIKSFVTLLSAFFFI